jgi:hypothetical protein
MSAICRKLHIRVKSYVSIATMSLHTFTSRSSAVRIARGYRLEGRDLIPSGETLLSSSRLHTCSGVISPGVKQPRRKADDSPPSNVGVKNGEAV